MQPGNPAPPAGNKRKGGKGCLSFLLVFVFILLAGSIIIGAIYGKANGDIGGGISSVFRWFGDSISGLFNNSANSSEETKITTITVTPDITPVTTYSGINPDTGKYKDYYLGLVKTPDGVVGGEGCYGKFIVLINNRNAKNPSYEELVSFLSSDNTDTYPYSLALSISDMYFGNAEDLVDLANLENIINGTTQPKRPEICSDFAERLHNNAELAGIRCGFVAIDSFNHALNVFETTDKGLVYVDDTGSFLFGPDNCDKIVEVKEGAEYIPVSLFPDSEWGDKWESLGVISGIFITWDGNWRN